MRYRLTHMAMVAALLGAAAAIDSTALSAERQHEHGMAQERSQPGMMAKCQAMMAGREKMMAQMKEADDRLDALVAKMNAASGPQKTDAIAATVTELVAQRKMMRDRMMDMHQQMMGHMMEHAQAGPGSMAMCPMMKREGAKD